MKTPADLAGSLTEHIMRGLHDQPPEIYNRTYSAVYDGLKSAEKVKAAVVPDNDWAVTARFASLPMPAKRAILALMDELEKAARTHEAEGQT
jgi:hypothetical protein